jgi:hypothetical protein
VPFNQRLPAQIRRAGRIILPVSSFLMTQDVSRCPVAELRTFRIRFQAAETNCRGQRGSWTSSRAHCSAMKLSGNGIRFDTP